MKKMEIALRSEKLLNHPTYNKGTAFTLEEREIFHLHGLLPFHVSTLEEQVARRYQNFLAQKDQLSKYTFLSSLQDRNEVLFYRLVLDHISEMLPFIYTPTIGEVSLQFSSLYHQHRGVYLSYPLQDKIEEIIANLPQKELDVVVITDGERILGLGDLGVGGMAIPQGKLSLYTLFGGIHPLKTLPILLDVGTNNQTLLHDPLYLGWRHSRVSDDLYYDFIDRFVRALKKRFPKVLLQWEDFSKSHAKPLLEKYQDVICSFNDDIQGTAAVTLSALLSAVQGSLLSEQKIVVFGAGSAGIGISHLIIKAMQEEGCSEQRARENFYMIDRQGLIHTELSNLDHEQKKLARDYQSLQKWELDSSSISLLKVIKQVKPTILIGVSAQEKAFTKEIVTEMGKYVENPIIFPLSNPNSRAEVTPEELLHWTRGRAIIATGSPFESVDYNDKQYMIAQCNNFYIFPGIGLGAIAAKIPKITDEMFIQAAYVLSKHSHFPHLFPPLKHLREISREIALVVIATAENQELITPMTKEIRETLVDQTIWFPSYPSYSFKQE
ncbi:MAG: NAD-dependent malic enzyme [Chlamydiales bacterium]|jgi:malate dehydrogenase (oxaloacetate-decarboxylating)|nr:NAD-dependent malic enzyme [Chlamydiales bacterium]